MPESAPTPSRSPLLEIIRMEEAVRRLPAEACRQLEAFCLSPRRFHRERILWVRGPFETDSINLDEWPGMVDLLRSDASVTVDEEMVLTVVVDGDLRVNTLYCEDSDASLGLVVLGNLEVRHAVVGGQLILVMGELRATDLFWGDYNHGDLMVNGRMDVRLLMATEEYHLPNLSDREGDRIGALLEEQDTDELEEDLADVAARYFVDELVDYDESDQWALCTVVDRDQVIEALLRGEAVLRAEFQAEDCTEPVPRIWAEVSLSDHASMTDQEALFAALLEDVPTDEPEQQFRCDAMAADVFVTRAHRRQGDGVAVPDSLTILRDDGMEVRMWVQSPGLLKRMVGSEAGLNAVYEHVDAGVSGFRPIWSEADAVAVVEAVWNDALRKAEAGRYWRARFVQRMNAEEVLGLLSLPIVVDHYNDWSVPDKAGFWDGYLHYLFVLPDKDKAKKDTYGALRLSMERTDLDEFDVRSYQFDVDDLVTPGPVTLRYRSSAIQSPLGTPADPYRRGFRYMGVFDGAKIAEALKWYERCAKRLPRCEPMSGGCQAD